jgi:hypothetical protein
MKDKLGSVFSCPGAIHLFLSRELGCNYPGKNADIVCIVNGADHCARRWMSAYSIYQVQKINWLLPGSHVITKP